MIERNGKTICSDIFFSLVDGLTDYVPLLTPKVSKSSWVQFGLNGFDRIIGIRFIVRHDKR